MIATMSARQKKQNCMRDELILQVATLEAENKQNAQILWTERLQQILHPIDNLDIAQSIMYAKQRMYAFKDKPGKQLARLFF